MRSPKENQIARLRLFLAGAEEGTQAIEFLLIFAFAVIPCFWAILLLQEILREYVEVETILVTSPFF